MKNNVALVIYRAQAAISEACKGRACLPECLRAIERAASYETATTPLCVNSAKAAKRTTAGHARTHGARLRVPVGRVRAAWRAFALLSRRACGSFRRIWRAMAARLPAIARRHVKGIAAFALTLGGTLLAFPDVICTWNGSAYNCSGEGSIVRVIGGGDGWSGEIVVTNIVGTCTNCVAMSPDYVREWKSDARSQIEYLQDGVWTVSNDASVIVAILGGYTNICDVSTLGGAYPATGPQIDIASNFLHSVGAYPGESAANKAAQVTQVVNFNSSGRVSELNQLRARLSFYDGAAIMYNEFGFSAQEASSRARSIVDNCGQLKLGLDNLDAKLDLLSDEQCTAQWDGSSGGSGGGSTVVTNQASGNWCTYDQGEAIKELLGDIKTWQEKQVSYLQSISNSVKSIDSSIKSALFSRYTHIPISETGESWQDVYLSGQATNWGYEPTNILQRIELLIYGMSGLGSNDTTNVSEETGVDPDDADTAGDDETEALGELDVGGSSASSDAESIMDALQSFFRTFNGLTGDRFGEQQIMSSYSIELGEKQYDVPALYLDGDSSDAANVIQEACRAFLVCMYLLFAVFCGWRFYVLFFGAVVKYAKWAQELLSSLFAD